MKKISFIVFCDFAISDSPVSFPKKRDSCLFYLHMKAASELIAQNKAND